jgi:hypothetical protein
MKKVVLIVLALSQIILLSACGSLDIGRMNRRDEARTKVVESQAKGYVSAQTFQDSSLGLAYKQIDKGEAKTDGQGLYVLIDNESRMNVNTVVVGPIPVTGVVNLGVVQQNLALALFQNGQYNHRSYYLEGSRQGKDSYEEDYFPPGKYIALSFYRGQPWGHGWCFEVTAQLHTYKNKKVHGYTVAY